MIDGSMRPGGGDLDSPPPLANVRGKSLMDTQSGGSVPANPQVAAMLGMSMLEQGVRIMSVSLPGLAPALQQLVTQLREIVPRALAESQSTSAGGLGGEIAPPPVPPPMQPPV